MKRGIATRVTKVGALLSVLLLLVSSRCQCNFAELEAGKAGEVDEKRQHSLPVIGGGEDEKQWAELNGDELESQLALYPNDEQETEALAGSPKIVFSDFCTSTRDTIMADLKSSFSGLVGGMLKLFMNSFEALGIDKGRVSEEVAEHSDAALLASSRSALISSGEQERSSSFRVDEEQNHRREDGPISRARGGAGVLFGAIVLAVSAVKNTVGGLVMDRLKQMGAAFGLDRLQSALKGTCDQISEYERNVRADFELVRAEVGGFSPELSEVQLEQLGCLTLNRLLRLQGICALGDSIAQHPLLSTILQSGNAFKFVMENRNIRDR